MNKISKLRLLIVLFYFSYLYPECCNMQMTGYINFGEDISDITGFKQDGREFAVVGLFYQSAAFVDITDPENPIELGRIDGSTNTWRDLKYWNRHVYIGTEANDGIKVVSVDDPDNPVLVHTINDFGNSHNIHIDADGFLYVVGTADHDIWIYDLINPTSPDSVGSWEGEYLHDIEVFNNKIYGAGITTGNFYIIDVSNKTNPTTILDHNTGVIGGTHDCAVTEDEQILITADETSGGHIKLWDISDYNNINLISEYEIESTHSMHNVYIRPGTNLAIMSYYVDGTRVLDISDPLNPVEVGYFDTTDLTGLYDGHWGTYAYLPSGHIISSDRQNGLFVFSSPLTDSSMMWSDCYEITGDNLSCYGDTYLFEYEILEEIINLNPELTGTHPEEIGKFVVGRVAEIDLSNRELTTLSLPDNIGSLTSLISMQLQDNLFTTIPVSILNVNSLIELDISGNLLTTIPDNIGVLTNLESFQLNDNDITTLPSTLCDLPYACMIDVTGNHLCSEILQTVKECVSTISYQYCGECESGFMLEFTCINSTDTNVLQSIIDSNESLNGQHPLLLGRNTQYSAWNNGNLEYLDLSDYNLTNIPNSIGDFEFLIEINLDGNLINSLPDSITYLESIKVLRLNNNLLSEIPDEIGNLTVLEELYLSGNQITSIPESIGNLQNLNKLFIRANQITTLPSTICNLPDNCNIQVQDNCLNTSYDCISNMGDQDNCPEMAINNYQPTDIQLFDPFPNPFNPTTSISFYLQFPGLTTIQIWDTNGRIISVLSNEFRSAGYYSVNWNASDYSSGVYLVKMIVGNHIEPVIKSQKLVLLK